MTISPYRSPEMAEVYRRIAAPGQFAQPGRDLIELLQPPDGARILDVGTGTGAVTERAIECVGSRGRVVGVDASITMLRTRPVHPYAVVAGELPMLPFRDATFDLVTAGFVLSHVTDDDHALRDVVRVCRPQGRVGMTAWGSLPNPAAQLWSEVAGRFVSRDELDAAFRAHIPWDFLFSEQTAFLQAFERSGFASVLIQTRIYRCRMPTTDFLTSREASIQGSVLADRLTGEGWQDFRSQVADAFRQSFGGVVESDRDVHFAVGTTP